MLDEEEINILTYFLDKENELTTVDIAKGALKAKSRDEIKRKVSALTYKLNKWVDQELLCYHIENNIKYYYLNYDKITFNESTLAVNGKVINMGVALIVEMEKDKYTVCFLEDV